MSARKKIGQKNMSFYFKYFFVCKKLNKSNIKQLGVLNEKKYKQKI